jgi:hypothetical protein
MGRNYFYLVCFLMLVAKPAWADIVCPAGETSDICVLQELLSRGDAAYAHAEGARRDEVAQRLKERDYWRNYIAGLPNVPELEKKIAAACSWRGTMPKPLADLCKESRK